MAQFAKGNGDLRAVSVYDAQGYINDAVKVSGYISGTTLTVVGVPSGPVNVGVGTSAKFLLGAGVSNGQTVTAIATGTPTNPLTLTVSISQTLGSATELVDFYLRSFNDVDVTIQPQGPKLQMFTINGTDAFAFADAIMKVVQTRCTVHMYEVKSNTTAIAFATYDTEAWGEWDYTVPSAPVYVFTNLDAALVDALPTVPATTPPSSPFTASAGATFSG